jgi:hypothetical protein
MAAKRARPAVDGERLHGPMCLWGSALQRDLDAPGCVQIPIKERINSALRRPGSCVRPRFRTDSNEAEAQCPKHMK